MRQLLTIYVLVCMAVSLCAHAGVCVCVRTHAHVTVYVLFGKDIKYNSTIALSHPFYLTEFQTCGLTYKNV